MAKSRTLTKRDDDFSKWYTDVIENANLIFYSSIKGEIILRPKAWSLWTMIQHELNNQFKKLEILNVCLPTFIKYSEFTKEKKHISGFAPEVFMVTQKGNDKLEDPYVVRPTSEVLFCEYFKKIAISYKDLPIKVNQWCNVFRAEKNTRPFLRTTEFFWQELHCIFDNQKDAEIFVRDIIDLYYKFITEILLIPCVVGKKTDNEKFAGAEVTYTIEAVMQDGQILQCATSHYLGNNFAKTYEIKIQNKKNRLEYVYQTSHGLSTRIIGALIMTHSDDKGLVLPFEISPCQILISGINCKKNKDIMSCINLIKSSDTNKYRVEIDISDNSFGEKIYNWERQGIPFLIIVGTDYITRNEITIFCRDSLEKINVKVYELMKTLALLKNKYQENLFKRAAKYLKNKTHEVKDIDEFEKAIKQHGLLIAPWGGDAEDEKRLKLKYGITTRCIKCEVKDKYIKCFYTKKPAKWYIYFGRAY